MFCAGAARIGIIMVVEVILEVNSVTKVISAQNARIINQVGASRKMPGQPDVQPRRQSETIAHQQNDIPRNAAYTGLPIHRENVLVIIDRNHKEQ